MPRVAQIDDEGVLLGYADVDREDWVTNETQIRVPPSCDLVPGKYWYDAEKGRWEPFGNQTKHDVNFTTGAIVDGFMALEEQGFTLPESTKTFCKIWQSQRASVAKAASAERLRKKRGD